MAGVFGYDPRKQLGNSFSTEAIRNRTMKGGGALGGAQKKTNVGSLVTGLETQGRGRPGAGTPDPADPNNMPQPGSIALPMPGQEATPIPGAGGGGGGAGGSGGGGIYVPTAQEQHIAALQAAAAGEGPSAAQDQLQLATDQNMRQALAMAASGRGNPALAMQAAGRQRGIMGQQHAAQSGALRAQEMQSAQGMLAQSLQTQRQQDQADMNRELGYAQLEAQQKMAYEANISQQKQAKSAAKASGIAGMLGMGGAVLGGLGAGGFFGTAAPALTGAATAGATIASPSPMALTSDERVKKDKHAVGDKDVSEFYAALKPQSYKYKDPHAAGSSGGEKVGMMAQDVEGTELGDKLFSRRADGISQYDPQVLDGILLAGMKKLMKDQKYGD